jgi:phospholipase C
MHITDRKTPMSRSLRFILRISAPAIAALAMAGCASDARAPASDAALHRIKNVVVIFAENHSFDNLYGLFPGADGIANATPEQMTQLDHDGKPLKELIVFGGDGKPDPRFPRMPNRPFRIDAPPVNRAIDQIVPSPTHAFFQNQEQINGGKNNMFAAMSAVGGWTMGHYDGSQFRLWQWAREYTLADRFFMGAFGGSYLNHQYLVCACAPRHDTAPASMRSQLAPDGRLAKKPGSPSANEAAVQLVRSGWVTPDGLSVNTSQPPYQPSEVPPAPGGPFDWADASGGGKFRPPTPPQDQRTIGDTLSAKGVSWAWYAGAWNLALADGRRPPEAERRIIYSTARDTPMFQAHHQPFNYYARFAPGTPERALHLRDGEDLLRDIQAGSLPAVVFYKPPNRFSQHPSDSDLKSGDEHMADLLDKLRASPQWKDMLIVLAYDENGGYWDHVPPPSGPGWSDRLGPGTRIPALIIGPHVKRGFIDHTTYDTASILKFITRRFGLEPLPGVREKTGDLSGALTTD